MLAILGDRKMHDRFYDHVRGNFLTKEGEDVGKHLHLYFDQDVLKSTTAIDWNQFATWYFLKNPMLSHEKKENFKAVFNSLDEYEAHDENFTQKILGELTTKHFATEIAKKAMHIADGSTDDGIESLGTIISHAEEEISEIGSGEDPTLVTQDLFELMKAEKEHPRLQFSLEGLRAAFSGISKGDLVVVGAHPDTGKTTFLMGEGAYMLPQMKDDQHILYFNNEQSGGGMAYRLRSAVLQKPLHDILADPAQSNTDYAAAGGERIMLYDKSYMTTKYIEERLKRYEGHIGLILFDQLWKIRGASNSKNDFMQMAHVYSWARDICKTHAPTIAVHQADAQGYNHKYMTMDHLFGSNIPIQGEADAIIMIGRMTDGSQRPDVRHFNVPKNKLPAGTDPTDRNRKFDVFIDHDLVRFRDV
jgi:hypothetical protein